MQYKERNRHYSRAVLLAASLLPACQSYLPALDSYPGSQPSPATSATDGAGKKPDTTPKASDVIIHIQCELKKILNTAEAAKEAKHAQEGADKSSAPDGTVFKEMSPEFARRLANGGVELPDASKWLVDAHFVASVQLTLEVTNVQGFTPSLTFQNAIKGNNTGVIGGQLNETQDRNITVSYVVDIAQLAKATADPCAESSLENKQSGIQGDLGLADIVADGLISLVHTETTNLYSSTGPTPITTAIHVSQSGNVYLPYVPASPSIGKQSIDPTAEDTTSSAPFSSAPLRATIAHKDLPIDSLQGTLLLVPQSAYVQTQGSAYFNGLMTIDDEPFMASWTGSLLPPNSAALISSTFFTVSGSLIPIPDVTDIDKIEKRWGISPTITLTGRIQKTKKGDRYDESKLYLAGTISPGPSSDYSRALVPLKVTLHDEIEKRTAFAVENEAALKIASASAAGAKPTTSTSTATAASGGTSFGSLVDFTLVWGLNGSPMFTWKHFVGFASSANPLGSVTHTAIDSMAITFVPACRDKSDIASAEAFWITLPVCGDLPSATQIGASIGYQNNQLMILRQPFNQPRTQ